MSIPNSEKQTIFHNVGGIEMYRCHCCCDPYDCPYVQSAENAGYNDWHLKTTGRYTDVYFGYYLYPSQKLPDPKTFCATCVHNNER